MKNKKEVKIKKRAPFQTPNRLQLQVVTLDLFEVCAIPLTSPILKGLNG